MLRLLQTVLNYASRLMVTGVREHNLYPSSGPLDGGKTLRPARLILKSMGVTRVDIPRDRNG